MPSPPSPTSAEVHSQKHHAIHHGPDPKLHHGCRALVPVWYHVKSACTVRHRNRTLKNLWSSSCAAVGRMRGSFCRHLVTMSLMYCGRGRTGRIRETPSSLPSGDGCAVRLGMRRLSPFAQCIVWDSTISLVYRHTSHTRTPGWCIPHACGE